MIALLLTFWACRSADSPAPAGGPDRDGDGFLGPADCDDGDAARSPALPEIAGDGIDNNCDGIEPVPDGRISGDEPDSGYGWSLALAINGSADGLYVGAPFAGAGAGAVYRDQRRVAAGAAGERLGTALAIYGGTPVAGAPGQAGMTGSVREVYSGSVLLTAPGAGRRLLASTGADGQPALLVAHAGGVLGVGADLQINALRLDTPLPPDAIAVRAGVPAAGMRRGDTALLSDRSLLRQTPDELGAALLRGDADGDGTEEWIAGAPGIGAVLLLDDDFQEKARISRGGGRFGHALALAEPGLLYVGAPLDGLDAQGAIYAVRAWGAADLPELLLSGELPDDQLGSSLIAGPGWLVAGAPGAADQPGSVTGLRNLPGPSGAR